MFKVGDKVFSYQFGWGKVEEIYEQALIVNFKDIKIFFTSCGRLFKRDLQPSLSLTEYNLVNGGFSQERPKEDMIGKLVRVLDDCEWEGFLGVLKRITPSGCFVVNDIEFENVELYEQG